MVHLTVTMETESWWGHYRFLYRWLQFFRRLLRKNSYRTRPNICHLTNLRRKVCHLFGTILKNQSSKVVQLNMRVIYSLPVTDMCLDSTLCGPTWWLASYRSATHCPPKQCCPGPVPTTEGGIGSAARVTAATVSSEIYLLGRSERRRTCHIISIVQMLVTQHQKQLDTTVHRGIAQGPSQDKFLTKI